MTTPPTHPSDASLFEACQLDLQAHAARQAGKFDAAVGLLSVGDALRNGQLTAKELHTDSKRARLFGGEAIGL